MSVKTKLDKLERMAAALPAEDQDRGSPLADEVRKIDEEIKKLEAEIAEAQVGMTPEELSRARVRDEEQKAKLVRLPLDEAIRMLEEEIALL